jgi:hypothetical protein
LIVRPEIAIAQQSAERTDDGGVSGDDVGDEKDDAHVTRRFYGVASIDDPSRLGRDAGRIATEIVAHLAGLMGTETEVTIEIRATNDDGFPDDVINIVTENAAALRFRIHGFEKS